MDYSYFTVAPQPYQLFGLPDYSNPHLDSSKLAPTGIDPTAGLLPYDAFGTFPQPAGMHVLPPNSASPPQQLPVGSADAGIELSMELDPPLRAARSSSEEKDTNTGLTPAQSRRKAQNRAAQRAFRERKERHVKSLEAKLASLESSTQDLRSDNERLKLALQRAKTENELLRANSITAGMVSSPTSSAQASPEMPPDTFDPDKDAYTPGPAVVSGQAASASLLSTGGTWDTIQSHPLVKSGAVDIADVCEKLVSRARCDGQGPVFDEVEIFKAIEEGRRVGGDDLLW